MTRACSKQTTKHVKNSNFSELHHGKGNKSYLVSAFYYFVNFGRITCNTFVIAVVLATKSSENK